MNARVPLIPIRVQRDGSDGITIQWPDGVIHSIPSRILREHCPAADSRAERGDASHEKPLTATKPSALRVVKNELSEQLRLERLWGIGNYAVGLSWGDGHKTGIYSYKLLRELGELSESKQANL